MTDIKDLLGEKGPLAACVPGFAARAEQQEMAAAVDAAIAAQGRLIVEAGTGTGKTFAYLMPALRSGKKIIISTGTRHLQDQLYNRDLPMVRDALQAPVKIALLKGRANYLCHHRLETVAGDNRSISGREADELETIRTWAGRTRTGDIAELGVIPESSLFWPRVTSTVDNCLGQECEYLRECFVSKARRKALDADVVVINHHLLFADMVLREEGFGELLPGVEAFIIDEAHQLPDVASGFFGISLSSHQLLELARDTRMEHVREAGDMAALPDAAHQLEGVVRRLRLVLGRGERRAAWSEIAGDRDLTGLLEELHSVLGQLTEWLQQAAQRGKGLDSCWQRSRLLGERFHLLQDTTGDDYIHWFETRRTSFRLNLTPLNVAPVFNRHLETLQSSWIFTSATLAVGSSFQHFAARLGLDGAQTLQLNSPFDYRHNALLYLPDGMPDPGTQRYTHAVVDCARKVISVSRGRAFVLFTSHSALQEAASQLVQAFDYPLLIQGAAPRQELLERFRQLGNAVLLGTSSFWEGVDVRGKALSCVIIDRLPFASPGDPVLQARIEALRKRGRNPFAEFQLPGAVLALKQGVGRLIRDRHDRGVLVICDPRLHSRSYGKVFLNSLPDMPRTRDMDVVQSFFSGMDYTLAEDAMMEQTLRAP